MDTLPTAENPYESPVDASAEVPETPADGRGMYPLGKIVLGPIVGAMFGGCFGPLGAAALGLIAGCAPLPHAYDLDLPALVFAGPIMGGVVGLMSGGLIGLILGTIACLAQATFRGGFIGLSAILCGAAGIVAGVFGGSMLSSGQFPIAFIWCGIGATCGGLAGVAGGSMLGKTLARVFWPRAADDTVDASENA